MKSLISIGIGFIILLFIFAVTQDYALAMKYAGYTGGAFLALAAVVSGADGSGDRIRANYSDKEDWKMRMNWGWHLLLIGAINLAACIIIYAYVVKPTL
ncbi:hypothetical protein DFP93_10610 [Aneurinibacillus soli]|uniref:Uncharacterized protein n=1 Tax=Aneurinibacillus soli TaxID=1500254 RepID=A0A0U5CA83_9BACL|nr:DUF5316 domain-containing protein [Aneurinibacillus soli]PYE61819.1 hypothetical protein DFP93_10610 [Aneurinibacillus soli]BAU29635.1 hypothetical protein CB4_03872 [Aneurinibacillus soli]